MQIEGFIHGAEFARRGRADRGVLHVLAIFDKPDPLDGPFFEETIYVTPSPRAEAPERQVGRRPSARRGARRSGCAHGPIHAECRVNGAAVFVLEVAARPIGGAVRGRCGSTAPRRRRIGLENCCCGTRCGEST